MRIVLLIACLPCMLLACASTGSNRTPNVHLVSAGIQEPPRVEHRSQVEHHAWEPSDDTLDTLLVESARANQEAKRKLMSLYTGFRYEEVLEQAGALMANRDISRTVKGEAALLAGASAYLLGRRSEAMAWFRNAHRMNPDLHPDDRTFPKDIIRLYAEAVQRPWTVGMDQP